MTTNFDWFDNVYEVSISTAAEALHIPKSLLESFLKEYDVDMRKNSYGHRMLPLSAIADIRAALIADGKVNALSALVIPVFNNKGGVGKTALCYALSMQLAQQGYCVLAWDSDPQCNLTETFGITPELDVDKTALDIMQGMRKIAASKDDVAKASSYAYQELASVIKQPFGDDLPLDVLPCNESFDDAHYFLREGRASPLSRFFYKELLRGCVESGEYDFIFIDLPPSFKETTRNAILASDYLLSPVIPEMKSIDGLKKVRRKVLEIIKEHDVAAPGWLMVPNRVEYSLSTHKENMPILQDQFGDFLLGKTIIRKDSAFTLQLENNLPLNAVKANSNAEKAIVQLCRDLVSLNESHYKEGLVTKHTSYDEQAGGNK